MKKILNLDIWGVKNLKRAKLAGGRFFGKSTSGGQKRFYVGMARRAENRRGLERMEEERMRLDREAQWLSRVRGLGLVHRGRFFI